MLLERLKPEAVGTLCDQIGAELTALENEIHQYDRALSGSLDESQRATLHKLRTRRARQAELYRARLDTLRSARYHDDERTVRSRILQVA